MLLNCYTSMHWVCALGMNIASVSNEYRMLLMANTPTHTHTCNLHEFVNHPHKVLLRS